MYEVKRVNVLLQRRELTEEICKGKHEELAIRCQ